MIIFHILLQWLVPAEGPLETTTAAEVLDRRARTAHISCERINVR
jgi:hypothetical protein